MSRGSGGIAALGGLFVALGFGWALDAAVGSGPPAEVVVTFLLVAVPGSVVLYGGYRIPRSDLDPDTHPRIAAWCFGGFGVLLAVFGLVVLNPGIPILEPFLMGTIASAIGSAVGLGIGVNEARALMQARAAEHHAAEAEQQREILAFLNSTLRHEVLNAVNVIQGTASLVAEDVDAESRSQLDVIRTRCGDLTTLIDDIGPMARAISGRAELAEVDLSAMVRDRVDALRSSQPAATVTADLPPGVHVRATPGLSYAVSNVLANTVEHNDTLQPQVDVSVTTDGDRVRLRIADDGPGIPVDEQERIFEPTTEHDRGFGLYMAQTIVAQCGGEFRIDDNEPRGTVVTMEFPRVRVDDRIDDR